MTSIKYTLHKVYFKLASANVSTHFIITEIVTIGRQALPYVITSGNQSTFTSIKPAIQDAVFVCTLLCLK